MTLLIFYVSLALGVSFLCSVLEAVVLSVTASYVAAMEKDQPAVGARLASLKSDIERPLAAILSLNTIAHTVGAAGAGAQALEVFGNGYVAATSAVLTLLILVVSEIIPKTLGAIHWKSLAPFAARVLGFLIVTMYPLVLLARGLSHLLSPSGRSPTVSRQELKALTDVVAREGVVDETESRVLRSLLQFRSVQGADIMTPRSVVVAFDERATVGDATGDDTHLTFSRFPLYDGTIDHVTGYALKQDILLHKARAGGDATPLSELRRDILIMPESSRLPELLEAMLKKKEHLVALVEEVGGVAGIVTLEDVVETLLGFEIMDETDKAEDMRVLARKRWAQRAKKLTRPPSEP